MRQEDCWRYQMVAGTSYHYLHTSHSVRLTKGQVRGIKGVDAQWISQRKDWEEAKRRTQQRKKSMQERDKKSAHAVPHMGLPQTEPEVRCRDRV